MKAALALLFALVPPAVQAQDDDLDRIPQAVLAPAAPPAPVRASSLEGKASADDAFTLGMGRGPLPAPSPGSGGSGWSNRSSLDGMASWHFAARASATFSDRVDFEEQDYSGSPASQGWHNDLREAYLSWQPRTLLYLDAGRINLRNGVALGYNPVDFFRARSGIDLSSADPSTLRNNRLGTVMARLQYLWDGGALTLAAAPCLQAPAPLEAAPTDGLNPRFSRTNGNARYLASLGWHFADLSPQALVEYGAGRTQFGFDLSHAIGKAVVVYAEWSGGPQAGLAERAVAFGQATGTLPPGVPVLQGDAPGLHWRNDAALGGSWTAESGLSLNLEYHYHQGGFTRADWRQDFAAATADPARLGALFWYLRAYASSHQEPVSRQQWFLRADRADAFVHGLELSGFAVVDGTDGSRFGQLAAAYDLDAHWTLAAYATTTAGERNSDYGSLPQAAAVALQLIRYF